MLLSLGKRLLEEAGAPAVMTAHIVLKDIDPNVPSTLSDKVLTGELRDKLGKGLPNMTGVRLALGIAWVVIVPAEMLGVSSGVGYEILNARDRLAYDEMLVVILLIGLIGIALDTLAQWLLRERSRG